MKKKSIFKYIYFILLLIISTVSISVIANGFSAWIFENSLSSKDLNGKVLVEDIKENYNFVQGTAQNSNTFDKKTSSLSFTQGVSSYTYKMLGGYTYNNQNKNPLNFESSLNEMTEFNFITTDTKFSDTAEEGLGRFYYLDKVYITSNDNDYTYAKNYNYTYLDSEGNSKTVSNITLKAKQSLFAISRASSSKESSDTTTSSSSKKDDTNNFLKVINQKSIFNSEYSNIPSDSFLWLQTNVIGKVNDYMSRANLKFKFDLGEGEAETSLVTDDYISKANGSNNHSESGAATTFTSDISKALSKDLDNKYFSCQKIRGYVNALVFVPFKRNYNKITSSKINDMATSIEASTDSNGLYIEEDFGFVAFSQGVDSSNNNSSSFIKIIDFTDMRGNAAMPTISNGGFNVDSDGYFDYSSNFTDNGNLFIDKFTGKSNNYIYYRRVIGISLNMSTYQEPYNSSDSEDYTLGSVITTLYSNYPDPFNNTDEWNTLMGADSLTKAMSTKMSSTYSLDIDNLVTLNDDGSYSYKVLGSDGLTYKLLDHLTYEEVDIIPNSYTYYDETSGEDKTVAYSEKNFGINFNKSMILLLVPTTISVKNTL